MQMVNLCNETKTSFFCIWTILVPLEFNSPYRWGKVRCITYEYTAVGLAFWTYANLCIILNMQNWLELLPGKWRLLYCTGRHIGLTLRQPNARVLIGDVRLTVSRASKLNTNLSFTSEIGFKIMIGKDWPHDKTGICGKLEVNSLFRLTAGRRLYLKEEKTTGRFTMGPSNIQGSLARKLSGRKWRKAIPFKEFPSSLPAAKLASGDIEVTMNLGEPLNQNIDTAKNAVQEIRTQLPPEMFDLSKLVCGTYVDSRLLVLRGVNGSALLFTRSCDDESSGLV